MIPHHAQALEMVEMAADRPLDPEVEELASAIGEAQAPEIETLTTWLETWDEEVPDVAGMSAKEMEDMEGMDGMEGMMSAMSMRQLENAPDEAFQDVWLALMLAHHKGAVAMADAEIAAGREPRGDRAGRGHPRQPVRRDRDHEVPHRQRRLTHSSHRSDTSGRFLPTGVAAGRSRAWSG